MSKFLLLVLLILSACSTVNPADYTVMVTNLQSNSGGSGSIIESSETSSTILTNGHVCHVVDNGGLVHSSQGEALVTSYRISSRHDLCALKVSAYMGPSTSLSKLMPEPFQDIQASGHPRLLPTIISKGHMSGRQVINVVTGMRACTPEETADPRLSFVCSLLGRLPIVKFYEADAMSATIQPGSSGSGVYNLQGKIVAVVFAGEGDFGYGFTVPYEYIHAFLETELSTLPDQFPDLIMKFGVESSDKAAVSIIRNECLKNPGVSSVCKDIINSTHDDMIFRSN